MNKGKLDELLRKQNFYGFVNMASHASKDWVLGRYAEILDKYDDDFIKKHPNLVMNTHGVTGVPKPKIPEHKHPSFELMYVYDGRITHHIGESEITLSNGDCLLIAPGTHHSVDASDVGDIAVNIIISLEFLSPDFMQLLASNTLFKKFMLTKEDSHTNAAGGFLHFESRNDRAVSDTAENIMCEFLDPDGSSASTIKCLLIVLFNTLFRVWKNSGGKVETRNEIDTNDLWQILQYLESNYSTATLYEAAFRFGYDSSYLSRLLKKRLGRTFTELKHHVCMEQAKAMLVNTTLSVRDIAMQTGFSNTSFFYSLFEKSCGMTPAEYLKTQQ